MKKLIIILAIILLPLSFIVAATTTYTVKKGDTLREIANKYGISLEKLLSLNPKLLREGTVLNVPATSTATNTPTSTTTPPKPLPPFPFETRSMSFVTGYTYWDNTPPGSSDISHPIIHKKAGGTGTYTDPITVAVGHSIINGKDILDFPEGTKFYIPNVRRYFIVEDTCGDGNTPQNGPCHTGFPKEATSWVDIWIDGASGTRSATDNCAEKITGAHLIIKNPASNYVVSSGPVFQNGSCTQVFGDVATIKI